MRHDSINKIIFRIKSGSHLYGLNRPESDLDYVSVFIPSEEYILGLKKVEEVDNSTKKSNTKRRNSGDDVDDKMYSLPKFLRLLMNNNPNIVETLFAPSNVTEILEPEFRELIENSDKIVSTKVFHSFTGYAYSQRKHLVNKRMRFKSLEEAKSYLNSIGISDRPITEEESSKLNSILQFYKGEKGNTESFHKGMPLSHIYSRIKSEYDMYGYRVRELNFVGDGGDSYDRKFAYHLIRLLDEGRQLLETGRIEFPLGGEAREDIIRIRKGEVPYGKLIERYDYYNEKVERIYEHTKLRRSPDFDWANKYLIRTLKESLK